MKNVGRWFGKRDGNVFDPLKPEVPPVVEGPLSYLEKNGINTEGIFRMAGSAATSRVIKARYDKGKPVDLSNLDVHTVAGIVTLFFRMLPNPLLTYELYDCFIAAIEIPDEETRLECIRQCMDLLPPGNKAVLARLVGFLQLVAQNKSVTKMDSHNLAIVFAPTILRPPEDTLPQGERNTIAALLGDSLHAHKLIELLIKNYDELLSTNRPVCKLKIRHSLTPIQQAAFYRTIKRGTIRLAEAMIAYDGFESPTSATTPSTSSSETPRKKDSERRKSKKDKGSKKKLQTPPLAIPTPPPPPIMPFPGVPLHTDTEPLQALSAEEQGEGMVTVVAQERARSRTVDSDEDDLKGYSGSDMEYDDALQMELDVAVQSPPIRSPSNRFLSASGGMQLAAQRNAAFVPNSAREALTRSTAYPSALSVPVASRLSRSSSTAADRTSDEDDDETESENESWPMSIDSPDYQKSASWGGRKRGDTDGGTLSTWRTMEGLSGIMRGEKRSTGSIGSMREKRDGLSISASPPTTAGGSIIDSPSSVRFGSGMTSTRNRSSSAGQEFNGTKKEEKKRERKRISLNRINGMNAVEKVSDMIRNVKERKKSKRDLGGGSRTLGDDTVGLRIEFKAPPRRVDLTQQYSNDPNMSAALALRAAAAASTTSTPSPSTSPSPPHSPMILIRKPTEELSHSVQTTPPADLNDTDATTETLTPGDPAGPNNQAPPSPTELPRERSNSDTTPEVPRMRRWSKGKVPVRQINEATEDAGLASPSSDDRGLRRTFVLDKAPAEHRNISAAAQTQDTASSAAGSESQVSTSERTPASDVASKEPTADEDASDSSEKQTERREEKERPQEATDAADVAALESQPNLLKPNLEGIRKLHKSSSQRMMQKSHSSRKLLETSSTTHRSLINAVELEEQAAPPSYASSILKSDNTLVHLLVSPRYYEQKKLTRSKSLNSSPRVSRPNEKESEPRRRKTARGKTKPDDREKEKSSRSLGKPPRSQSSLATSLPLPEGSPRSSRSPRDPQSRGHRSHRDKPKGGSAILIPTGSRSARGYSSSERRRPEERTERLKRLSNSFDTSYSRDRGYGYDPTSDKRRKDREDDGDRRERREHKERDKDREDDRRERRERKERNGRKERKERKGKEHRDRKDDSMSSSSTGYDIWLKPPPGHETELGRRSISSPALFCPPPQNEKDEVELDPHQIAESILNGNLADLWEKYLSTLQPSRRVSTDRKIVSILKEKLKWLDSEDTLEKLLDQEIEEGTDASTSTSTARSVSSESRILSDARSRVPLLGPVVDTTSPRISSPLSSRARLPVMIPVIDTSQPEAWDRGPSRAEPSDRGERNSRQEESHLER